MDLKTVKAWLAKNKKTVLGAAGVAVVGLALYTKHKGTTAGSVTPATTDAATVAADQGLGSGSATYGGDTGGGSGMDSVISSDLDAQVTTLQQLLDAQNASQTTLGQIGSTLTTIANGSSGPTSTGGSSSSGGSKPGGRTPRSSKHTTASQIDQYVIEYDTKAHRYYDVTSRGTVHHLTAAQLAADRRAGATTVKVPGRPMPAAAPRPAPRRSAPRPKPRSKK